jgi:hypothetical protein
MAIFYTDSGSIDNLIVTSSTGTFTGSFSGSLVGTASYVPGSIFTSANRALSASNALTASYAIGATSADAGFIQGTPITTTISINNTSNVAVEAYVQATINISGLSSNGSSTLTLFVGGFNVDSQTVSGTNRMVVTLQGVRTVQANTTVAVTVTSSAGTINRVVINYIKLRQYT